ncbi:hypothetical protein [Streptomyces sp. NPDC050422]|uniref:hypothetical protein n=1 Tax=Streptomyces sp. NPDC050422 TaxID=3365614 RepID=UPI0037B59C6C
MVVEPGRLPAGLGNASDRFGERRGPADVPVNRQPLILGQVAVYADFGLGEVTDLGQYDDEGLREQRDWSRRIISGLEEFAHTFEPGYFTEGGWIGGPTWVTDPKSGLDCSGSIEMGQLLTPPANLQTDYHQRDNTPIP